MKATQFRSFSMKNLRNPAAQQSLESFEAQYSKFFEDSRYNMNECEKIKSARQSLHRYIFIICHTTQHFGHNLTANERILVQSACEKTLQRMWHGNMKSLEDYRSRISQLLKICSPLMQRLFQAEQQTTIKQQHLEYRD